LPVTCRLVAGVVRAALRVGSGGDDAPPQSTY
jgi:hypothetical protein